MLALGQNPDVSTFTLSSTERGLPVELDEGTEITPASVAAAGAGVGAAGADDPLGPPERFEPGMVLDR